MNNVAVGDKVQYNEVEIKVVEIPSGFINWT